MNSYPNKFKIPVNPEAGDYDFCLQRGSERLLKPIHLPNELNGVLLLEQYQNIVDSISIKIEECSKNRKVRLYLSSSLIFTIFIPVFLVLNHKISIIVHIIMMASIFITLAIFNLISYYHMESNFDSLLNDLNNSYLQNGIKLYKVNKPFGMGNYRYTLKRIYILYSNQNNYITPEIPPQLYYLPQPPPPPPQQQQPQNYPPHQFNNHISYPHLNQNQYQQIPITVEHNNNNNNNSIYPVILTTKITSSENENSPLI